MKLRHTIFNSIGLAIAGIAGVCFILSLIAITSGRSYTLQRHPVIAVIDVGMELAVALCLGGGGLANILAGRLKPKATITMIVVSFLTCAFIPLGIWGIFELTISRDRKRARQETSREATSSDSSSQFSIGFLRQAATFSWAAAIIGFVVVLLCGSTHVGH